jgi:hypothetical protein
MAESQCCYYIIGSPGQDVCEWTAQNMNTRGGPAVHLS